MPDRYGERDAVDTCDLCDEHGRRNGFDCDHQDHAGASRRGMDMIREAMGWQ